MFIVLLLTVLPTAFAFQRVVTDVKCRFHNWDLPYGENGSKNNGNDGKWFQFECQKRCYDSWDSAVGRNTGVRCAYSWKEVNNLGDDDDVIVDVVTTMDRNSCGDDSYYKVAAWDSEGNKAEDTSKHFGKGYLWLCAKKRKYRDVKADLKAGRNGQVVIGLVATTGDWWGWPWNYLGKWDNHDWKDAYAFATHNGNTETKQTRHYIMIFQEKQDPQIPKVVTVVAGWDFYHQTRGEVPIQVAENYAMNVGGQDATTDTKKDYWSNAVSKAFKFSLGYKGMAEMSYARTSTKTTGFQHTLQETCVRTFQQNRQVSYKYVIPAAKPGEPRFSNFWYWKVTAYEGEKVTDPREFDDQFSATMNNYKNAIQTTGCGYDVAPNCLPGYCMPQDPNCWRCTEDFAMIDPNFKPPAQCSGAQGCTWVATPPANCPARWQLASLKYCSSEMTEGEQCQEYLPKLPNGDNANVKNCGLYNVFDYKCGSSFNRCFIYNTENNGDCPDKITNAWSEDTWGRDHQGSWDAEAKCLARNDFCGTRSMFCFAESSSDCAASGASQCLTERNIWTADWASDSDAACAGWFDNTDWGGKKNCAYCVGWGYNMCTKTCCEMCGPKKTDGSKFIGGPCTAQLYEGSGSDMNSKVSPCPLYSSTDPAQWIDVCHQSDTVHVSSGCSIQVEDKDGKKYTFDKSFAAETEGVGWDAIRKIRLYRTGNACSAQLYEGSGTDMSSQHAPCPLYTSTDPGKWIDVCPGSDTVHISSGCSIEVETQEGRKFTFDKSFAASTVGVGYDAIRKIRLYKTGSAEYALAMEQHDKLKAANNALKQALKAMAN